MSNPENPAQNSPNSIDSRRKTALLARRSAYCAAMGIDVWVARKPLEGVGSHQYLSADAPVNAFGTPSTHLLAKTSPLSVPSESTAAPQQTSANASSARQAFKSSLQDTQPATVVAASAKAKQQAAVGQGIAAHNNFELSACSIDNIFILDDVSRSQFAPSVYQNWIAALSLALGKTASTKTGVVNHLRWPEALAGIGAVIPKGQEEGLAAAREVIQAWMLRQFPATPTHILLMGDMPNQLIDEQELESMRSQYPQMAKVNVVRTIASVQAWQAADDKRQLWAQIAPLAH